MKKYLFLLLTSCVLATTFIFIKNKPLQNAEVKMPSGAEEGGDERDEWELSRLADPVTGKIPDGIRSAELAFAKKMPHADESRSGATWESRGPWNVGGRTRAFAFDVADEKHILAGSVSGSLFISDDGGAAWRPAKGIGNNLGVVSIAQDTRSGKQNIWYALTGEGYGTSASGGGAFFLGDGMFKSTDNGENWVSLASTNSGTASAFSQLYQLGWRTLVDNSSPVANDVVFMATYGGIYRSANGGTSWTLIKGKNASPYSYFTDIAQTLKGVLYATLSSDGQDKGIWRSTNNGVTWTNITPSNFPPKYDRIVLGINPNNEDEVYFLANTDGYGHSTKYIDALDWSSLWRYNYVSGDGAGANGLWVDLSKNLPNTGTQFDRFACQNGYDLAVTVQPKTNNVFIAGANIFRSTDGFTTPNNSTKIGGYKIGTDLPYFEIYPNHHPDVHGLHFSPSDNNKLYSNSDGGIHYTSDCNAPFVNWTSLNNGYVTTQLYSVAIEHTLANDPTIVGCFQDNGNFFVGEKNPKKSWVQTVNGDGAYGAITNGKKNYYLSIQNGRIAKCDVDKDGKVLKYNRIDRGGKDYQFINQFVLDPNNENTMYVAGGKRLLRNDKLDKIQLKNKWDTLSPGWFAFPDTIKGKGVVTAVAASKFPVNRVYFGSTNGKIYRVDNANTDTAKYKEITVQTVTADRFVNCITIDPDNADNVVVTYSNYSVYSIFQTKDGGTTWQKVAGNLETSTTGTGNVPSIRWISILKFPNGVKKYFAATSIGLYSADSLVLHTNTTGTKWALEGDNTIGNVVCNYVETRSIDGLVVVATHGAGVFSANFDANVISKTKDIQSNIDFTVYPNPTRDVVYWKTNENFSPNAKIYLYDSNGRLLKQTFLSDNKLIVSDLGKGVYLLQIKDADKQLVKKILVE